MGLKIAVGGGRFFARVAAVGVWPRWSRPDALDDGIFREKVSAWDNVFSNEGAFFRR